MRISYIKLKALLVLLLALTIAACSDDSGGTIVQPEETDYTQILNDYTDLTVLATYNDMMTNAEELNAAVTLFSESSTQDNLNAACEKWRQTRKPWEQSEAFLFGPAAFLSLDPSLDSWPLDQSQLENVLKSPNELTPEFVKDGLGQILRGFHTIEFLLFRNGSPRNAADVTDREKEYLIAVTAVLADDATTLYTEWNDGFAAEFKNAGNAGSRYATQQDAVLELVEGIIDIADEVGNGKIADPYNAQDLQLVESQFSWNSLTDYTNNIHSIANAYMGGYNTANRGASLSDFVKEKNPELDAKIQAEFTAAIDAIQAIPAPFENNLSASANIEAAMDACNAIQETFQTEVKPLIAN